MNIMQDRPNFLGQAHRHRGRLVPQRIMNPRPVVQIAPQPKNLKALINQPGQWVDEVHQRKSIKESYSTWIVQTVQPLENRKGLLTTVISVILVIIPCSYSINLVILNVPCSATAMSTAVMIGKRLVFLLDRSRSIVRIISNGNNLLVNQLTKMIL